MDAKSFNGSDDRDSLSQPNPTHDELVICRDCGVKILWGGVTTGVGSGASCGTCYGWRVDHGVVFDPLPICAIKRGDRW